MNTAKFAAIFFTAIGIFFAAVGITIGFCIKDSDVLLISVIMGGLGILFAVIGITLLVLIHKGAVKFEYLGDGRYAILDADDAQDKVDYTSSNETKFCSNCGAMLAKSANFCTDCGSKQS